MIDPKYSFQILRPEAQASQPLPVGDAPEQEEQPMIEHDEPDNPIHPELEYEVLLAGEDSSTGYVPPAPNPVEVRRKRTLKNDVKLLVSFVCLVVFGYVYLC